MIFEVKKVFLCPVPEDQKPITEYLLLTKNSFCVYPKKKVKKSSFFPNFFGFLVLFPFFSLQQKFKQSRFFYEENSWYQAEIWEKPFLVIKNDHLLNNQRIGEKLQKLCLLLLLTLFFSLHFL
uniref:Ycf36 n=1 Tax=Synura sphagnicola TaxID=52556 RepID=A0A3G2QZG1_9STRA|nr:Ycf36 [Synura sphagnicola]AYO28327.1 Ycf36 [Synura sphagnicola]